MWTLATPSHIPLLQTAFAELRERRRQHYVSYLADPRVADFHRDRLISRIQKNPENSRLRLLIAENRLLASIGVEASEWHQKRLGVRYYKIQPFFCFTDHKDEIEQISLALRDFVIEPHAVYTTRVEAHQTGLAYYLARQNFTPVGTSIRLVRDGLQKNYIDSQPLQPYDNLNIRPYRETDLPILQDIIRRSHRHSHFFCEARFDPERVRGLYAEWIELCTKNPAYRILIADRKNETIGFCSAVVQNTLNPYVGKPIGIIDFIVVDYGIQGQGIGRALLEAAFEWFQPQTDCIELRTMADNLQAIRFYEKNGFRMLSADHHFHHWTT
jgi:ribosomal protein S18 acetylase RimI-like enzyme